MTPTVNVNLTTRSLYDYETIALVDLNYLFTRNYRGAGKGAPPNAGADRTILDLAGIDGDVSHMIVCLDWGPYARAERYPAYKAHRKEREPEELGQRKALIEHLKRLGYTLARAKSYEADDVIATLAKAYGVWCRDVRLVCPDKDAAQCITANVTQFIPPHGNRQAERRSIAECKKKFGVEPAHMPLWQALVGDPDDNVPGVKGIGDKKATEIIAALRAGGLPVTLDGLASLLGTKGSTAGKMWTDIAAHWSDVALSLELVTLALDVPLDIEALLVKQAPTPSAPDTPMGVELEEYVGNATPAPEREPDVAPLPRIGKDPGADEFLGDFARERQEREESEKFAAEKMAERVAAANTNAPRTPERVAETAARIAADNQAERTRLAPAKASVTEAEFDPISRAPGAAEPLPPLPPSPPVPSAAAPVEPVKPIGSVRKAHPDTVDTTLVRTEVDYGLVTTDLQPQDLRAARAISVWIAKSGLYKNFDTPEKVFAVLLRGKEMGLKATTALAGFHVIEGKPSASADLIRALAERDPNCEYFMLVEADDSHAVWETKHRKHPRPTRHAYTMEQALKVPTYWKKDKWGNEGNWVLRPQEMFVKTGSSQLARLVYAGSCLGLYCPEEMGGAIDTVSEAA